MSQTANRGDGTPPSRPPRLDLEFACVPIELLEDRTLFPVDRLLAAILAGIAGTTYCAWPCNRTLAARVGCSERTVQLALERLEAVGWITREEAPTTRRGSLIRLNWSRKRGAQRVAGGGAMGCAPRRNGLRPELDSKNQISKPERACATPPNQKPAEPSRPEDDVLSPEDHAHWVDLAIGGDMVMRRMARGILKRHEEAVRKTATAPGDRYGSDPGAAGQGEGAGPAPVDMDSTTGPTQVSRPV